MDHAPSHHDDLLDVTEPDVADLLADEQEGGAPARRRALVVLINDHPDAGDPGLERLIADVLAEENFLVGGVVQVESEEGRIREAIETAVVGGVDVVLTIGGTGVGPRDVAPEATRSVIDRDIPGIAEAMRRAGLGAQALDAMTSRGVAGISGSTVVVNVAGSRAAVRCSLAASAPLIHYVVEQL
ncbi:molybdopterin-binding protein [Corynebacterium uropygiale]|uniref:Molybdopterin-binding protein n=1 Tax=Corynebacterium uropygiale TaxID=1775911 RepID=A0A9X1QSJ7_9CORY|nr:molybdopterin-binding protein [Corynebacterium uropygiale]MCF4006764.1 molybdopterin-binding protein [Corynebacterium uropygiale]